MSRVRIAYEWLAVAILAALVIYSLVYRDPAKAYDDFQQREAEFQRQCAPYIPLPTRGRTPAEADCIAEATRLDLIRIQTGWSPLRLPPSR